MACTQQSGQRIHHHEILEEFLRLVSYAPVVSAAALPIQRLLIQAAIDLLRSWARELLKLEHGQCRRIVVRPDLRKMQLRPTSIAGFPQIYILDPDRNIIEFNFETMD